MRRLINISLMLSLILSTSSFANESKSMADFNIEVLDSFCVQNSDDFYNIVHMAPLFEGMEFPDTVKNADPNLRKSGGTGYYIKYHGKLYMLAFSKTGGCSVVSMDIDHANLSQLVVERYAAKLIDSESTGYQTIEMYRVGLKGSHNGSVITIMYPFDSSGYKEGTIDFINKTTMERDMDARKH